MRPVLTYPSIVLSQVAKTNIKKIQTQQNKLLRLTNSKPWDFKTTKIHEITNVPLIEEHLTDATSEQKLRVKKATTT